MKSTSVSMTILCALSLAACGQPAWRAFTSEKGGFTVSVPRVPTEQTNRVTTAVGAVDMNLYVCEAGDVAYFVGYSDYPQSFVEQADVAGLLAGAMNGAAGGVGGTIRSSRDISLEGHPGKEFKADAKINGRDGTFEGRVFLVGNRLYQIFVVGLKHKASPAKIDQFLRSFTLLP